MSIKSLILKHGKWLGWLLLSAGVAGYVMPLYYDWFGFRSGLFAFLLIFLGISILRLRKDQLNHH